jgi:peptidoglycan/LPS O-acetylase OafA/YrhL
MTQVETRAPDSRARLEYQPALDGVRAVAVAMVLLFHAGFGWMRAGYLGVSIFFTLSGFLITSLLLREGRASGNLDLGRFYARRLRRLLPASILCLTFIGVAYVNGEFATVPRFRGQMLGAALNVYNWVQIGSDSQYGDLFAGAPALTSPLEHYWSLAIEEQFYLIWPVVLLLIIRRSVRGPKSIAAAISGLFVLFAVISPLLAVRFGPDFAYWSTPTRFAEILAGAALAALLLARGHIPRWVGRLALPALVGLVALAIILPSASGPAYTGWMGAIAVVSGLLILGLQAPSPLRNALSVLPLVALGRVSYGVYLFHWPVFVLYRQHGWDLTEPGGFSVAVTTTMAIAAASYYLLEQVVRSARWPNTLTIVSAMGALGIAAVAILAMPVSLGFLEPNTTALENAAIDPDSEPIELTGAEATAPPSTTNATNAPSDPERAAEADGSTSTAPSPTNSTTLPAPAPPPAPAIPLSIALPEVPNRPVRILMVGDSTAFSVGQALAEWSVDNSEFARSSVLWCPGCGFILEGTITSWDAERAQRRSAEIVREVLPQMVDDLTPDVVVLMSTVDDLTNRIWMDGEGILTPFDELYVDRMAESYNSVTARLIEMGVPNIVWIAPPVPYGYFRAPEMAEVKRWEVMDEVLLALQEDDSEHVTVIDLDEWMKQTGHADDQSWRPDGTHLAVKPSLQLVDGFLGPLVVRLALDAAPA